MSAGGISRSGRVRKKSAKLMEMETRDSSESEGKPRLIKGKSIEKSIGLSDTEPPISKKAALIRTPKTQAPTGNLPFKKKSSKIVSQIVFQTTDQTESGSDIDEDIQEDVSVKNEVEEHGVDRVSATSDVQFKAEFEVKLEPEELLMSEDENSLIDPVGSDSDCDPEIKTDSSLCSFEEPFLKNETDLQMNDKETEQQVLASSNGYIVPDKIGEVLSLEFGDTSTIKDESDIMMNNAEAGLQSSNRRKQLLQPITEDKMEQIQRPPFVLISPFPAHTYSFTPEEETVSGQDMADNETQDQEEEQEQAGPKRNYTTENETETVSSVMENETQDTADDESLDKDEEEEQTVPKIKDTAEKQSQTVSSQSVNQETQTEEQESSTISTATGTSGHVYLTPYRHPCGHVCLTCKNIIIRKKRSKDRKEKEKQQKFFMCTCHDPPRRLLTKESLIQHVFNTRKKGSYICKYCKGNFSTSSNLKRHERNNCLSRGRVPQDETHLENDENEENQESGSEESDEID